MVPADRCLAPVLVLLLTAVAGCSVSGRYAPMTIEVRDAETEAPVPNALVEARALHFFLPVEQGVYLRPHPDEPKSVLGRTDADGRVRLNVVVDAAVQVVVVAPGYDVQSVGLEEHPVLWEDEAFTSWVDADLPIDETPPRQLQVRFQP
ncbi:MAG: hypothetical protein ACYTGG_08045 [Planctomycetota bacterium]|jgi:hypothetical protein